MYILNYQHFNDPLPLLSRDLADTFETVTFRDLWSSLLFSNFIFEDSNPGRPACVSHLTDRISLISQ
jgi:hypothetical protein